MKIMPLKFTGGGGEGHNNKTKADTSFLHLQTSHKLFQDIFKVVDSCRVFFENMV